MTAARLGMHRGVHELDRCGERPRLRAGVPLGFGDLRHAPVAPRGRCHPLDRRVARMGLARRGVLDRVEHDAPSGTPTPPSWRVARRPGSSVTSCRSRRCCRGCPRLSPRPAGGQGARVRRRRYPRARAPRAHGRRLDDPSSTRARCAPRAWPKDSSRPILRRRSFATGCRSARPIGARGGSSSRSRRMAARSPISPTTSGRGSAGRRCRSSRSIGASRLERCRWSVARERATPGRCPRADDRRASGALGRRRSGQALTERPQLVAFLGGRPRRHELRRRARRAVEPEPPRDPAGLVGGREPHGRVGALFGERRIGPSSVRNPGSPVSSPGVSAHPGCIAQHATRSPRRRLPHSSASTTTGPLRARIRGRAGIVLGAHLELVDVERLGVHAPLAIQMTRAPPGVALKSGRSSFRQQERAEIIVANVIS